MAVQAMGGWLDDLGASISSGWNNLFGSTPDYTDYWNQQTGGGGSAGFGYGDSPFNYGNYTGLTPDTSYTTTFDQWWKDYSATGGVMTPTTGQVNATGGSDVFAGISSGLNDFLSGVNSTLGSLGGIFGQGLQAYAAVQQLINAQNPQDQIIQHPQLGVVVQRTQGGSTTYVPVATAYPQFAGQIQQAEKQSNMNTILLVGALGLGAFILLKKK